MGKLANIPGAHLVVQINTAYRAARGKAEETVLACVECGRLLIEAKEVVGHGGWLAWVEANTEVGARQCQTYMQLAKGWPEIESNTSPDSHLTIRDALKLLAPPKPKPKPKTTVEYIIDEDAEEEPPPHQLPTSMRVRGFLHRAQESAQMARDDDLKGVEITKAMEDAACDAMNAWKERWAGICRKRLATLPADGRSEMAVDDCTPENEGDYDLGDIPACLDRRAPKSSELFAKLEAELKSKKK